MPTSSDSPPPLHAACRRRWPRSVACAHRLSYSSKRRLLHSIFLLINSLQAGGAASSHIGARSVQAGKHVVASLALLGAAA